MLRHQPIKLQHLVTSSPLNWIASHHCMHNRNQNRKCPTAHGQAEAEVHHNHCGMGVFCLLCTTTNPKQRQPPVRTTTTSTDPVLDQFLQMRSMISTFLGTRQDPTPSPQKSFCNYLHSEIEHLEERDFLTFRNETVKLLSEIQYNAEECKRQVTTSQ